MGKVECVKEFIKAGADVNMRHINGRTVLMAAKEKTLISLLLEAGADVNAKDNDGRTALIYAVEQGNEAIVQLLLEKRSKVNVENSQGITPLYMAVNEGHTKYERAQTEEGSISSYARIVLMLLQAGAALDHNTCTAHLMRKGKCNVGILKMLSAAGANIEETEAPTSDDNLQDLVTECIRRHLKQMHPKRNLFLTILQLGLPPRLQSHCLFYMLEKVETNLASEENELLLKASAGDVECTQNLIKAGVNVNIHDENGMTALMMASEAGHVKLIDKLIEKGADVNIQCVNGYTALIYAIRKQERMHCEIGGKERKR